MSTPPADMFHEKQHLMHCAIHTLNNLFQEPWASAPLMEDLAGELFKREAAMRKECGMGRMWINPYKSVVPQIGYYDINVLLEALKLKTCHVSLHAVFNPKDPNAIESSFQTLDTRGVRGVVINRVARTLLGGLYTSHHYYAIIPTMTADNKPNSGGEETTAEAANRCVWYIVDSKSPGPEIVGGAAELATHLAMEAREHKGHVFVVSDGEGEGCIIEGGVDGGEGGESGGLEAEE